MTMSTTTIEQRLTVAADPGGFSDAEVAGCDEPVRRYFHAAIAPGTRLARAARLRMRGSIKFANRWVPFRSVELLAPLHGYYWPATVAGGLLPRLRRLRRELRSRRLDGVEAPRTDTRHPHQRPGCCPERDRTCGRRRHLATDCAAAPLRGRLARIRRRAPCRRHPNRWQRVTLHITIGDDGLVRSDHLDRWNDPDGTGSFGWYPFGIEVSGLLDVPVWHHHAGRRCRWLVPRDRPMARRRVLPLHDLGTHSRLSRQRGHGTSNVSQSRPCPSPTRRRRLWNWRVCMISARVRNKTRAVG